MRERVVNSTYSIQVQKAFLFHREEDTTTTFYSAFVFAHISERFVHFINILDKMEGSDTQFDDIQKELNGTTVLKTPRVSREVTTMWDMFDYKLRDSYFITSFVC
jgi:hypothetical protein